MSYAVELPAVYLDALSNTPPDARLVLLNRNPEPAEVEVDREAVIMLMIADLGALPGIDLAATRVSVDGVEVFNGGTFAPSFAGAQSNLVVGLATLAIYLDRIEPYASQQDIGVRVTSRTLDGNATLDVVYPFTVEDKTAPQVVAAQARELRLVRLAFNESVLQASAQGASDALNPANYSILPLETPAVTPEILEVRSITPQIVDLVTAVELSFGKLHQIIVTGVEDLKGNTIAAPQNVTTFTSVRPHTPLGRDFQLYSMLPRKNRREDTTGDLLRFIQCLQDITDLLLWDIDRFNDILDPDFAEEQYLDAMLAGLGNPFRFELSTIDKRRLLRVLVAVYRQKGTERGLKNAVRFFLGVECDVLPWSEGTWVLGESELGDTTLLGPSGSWALYAFDVQVDVVLTAEQRSRLRRLGNYLKPAHTHFVNIIEPITPVSPDHLELGVSLLGESWELH